jgi:phosphoribosylformylglycinamidine synthase PurS subunit
MFKASVTITPKAGISDPQGAVIERALPNLGFEGVGGIRVGRFITLEVDGEDEAVVRRDVEDMCRQLLANPIIEDYSFELVDVSGTGLHGPDSVILGEDAHTRVAPPHAASPWTAADPFAAGEAARGEAEARGNEPPSASVAGARAEPSPWTAADPYANKDGAGQVAPVAGGGSDPDTGAPSPWTFADPFASREEEVEE